MPAGYRDAMAERVATLEDAAAAFRTFADAEGERIPAYARLCRIIAADESLHGLLLEAPTGQRLPVLLLAAIHDTVLANPEVPLAPWYPSVSGPELSTEDPGPALRATVTAHRARIVSLLRTRQVQTNEVNRCCAWQLALARLTASDHRPIHLVEIGASAGLNLLLDRYRYTISSADGVRTEGPDDASVQLATTIRRGDGPHTPTLDAGITAEIVSRVGLDQRPLDAADPDDARWLEACVWPEQQVRFERLSAALSVAAQDPPRIVQGDLVDDLAPLLAEAPDGAHVVVLSSWVLAYVARTRREDLWRLLQGAAVELAPRSIGISLLTLEAENVLDRISPPPLPDGASADDRFASILAATTFAPTAGVAPEVTVLARCQAHLVWADLLV